MNIVTRLKAIFALGLFGSVFWPCKTALAQDFTTTCTHPSLQSVQVQWGKSPAFGNFLYTIKSLRNQSNQTGAAGWKAYHRPDAGFPALRRKSGRAFCKDSGVMM
jgi:hypothetical protein